MRPEREPATVRPPDPRALELTPQERAQLEHLLSLGDREAAALLARAIDARVRGRR